MVSEPSPLSQEGHFARVDDGLNRSRSLYPFFRLLYGMMAATDAEIVRLRQLHVSAERIDPTLSFMHTKSVITANLDM